MPAPGQTELVVASFNVHSGVDGWGRRFDVVAACARCDADVLVLQESWTADGGKGMAQTIADELGYEAHELANADGRLSGPHPHPGPRWKPPSRRFDGPRVVLPDRTACGGKDAREHDEPYFPDNRRWPHGTGSERGTWSVAVLSRLPVESTEHDRAPPVASRHRHPRCDYVWTWRRRAGPSPLSGLTCPTYREVPLFRSGAPAKLHSIEVPAVLAGDMNLWGPPLVAQLPGWHRAVKGRTWPAWRPHSQPDHILVRPPIPWSIRKSSKRLGSDHRPVRARLAIPASGIPG